MLLDNAKESQVRELGEGIKEIELYGNYFGQFSLRSSFTTGTSQTSNGPRADFYKVFSIHDAQLYEEQYNLLNAFLAAVPGNHAFNLRYLYLLNTNYADFLLSFHSPFRRDAERASPPGISRRARDQSPHAVLPESALPRCRPHDDSRPKRRR